jgi:hypothetical protein
LNSLALLFDPVVVHATAAAMGIILILGALAKLRDIELFSYAVENYRLLNGSVAVLFARVFPLLELAAGILLVIETTRTIGMLLGLLTMALATAGVVISLLRGLTTIECGCGTGGQRISWGLVGRNVVLSLAIVLGASDGAARSLGVLDYFSAAGAILGLLALYACVNQLLANQPLLKELQS